MSLVIISPAKNLDRWINAIKSVAPEIEVKTPEQVTDRGGVKFALAWSHPPGVFIQFPNLKCISSMGAGVDHLISDTTIPGEVPLVRLIDPDLSNDIYEFSLAAIMNRLRSLTDYKINQTRNYWKKKPYMNIRNARIGIMGTGVIGNYTAENLMKVGFNVQGWSRTEKTDLSYHCFAGSSQLKDFLSSTDILICLLPLTKQTQGILNRENLFALPRGSWLINIGRGGHVSEQDLINVLDSGHLDGANLDVFPQEPLPENHPFWKHPKIIITPHIASLTTPESVAPQIGDNYYRAIENRPLLNLVDKSKGY